VRIFKTRRSPEALRAPHQCRGHIFEGNLAMLFREQLGFRLQSPRPASAPRLCI
jgi:hypothetical protein